MKIHTRAEWGARPPKQVRQMAGSQGVHLHYNGPAVPPAVYAGDFESVKSFLRNTQNFHMNTRGWADIAYSFFVDRVGRIWEGRGWGVIGGHTQGFNSTSHAIYFILGDGQVPTPEQVESVRQLISEHNRRYGVGYVRGHQQAPGNSTSCPGDAVMQLINSGSFNVGAAAEPAPADVDWAALRRYIAAVLLEQVRSLPMLRRGMRGGRVETWQKALNLASGTKLAEDGVFGTATDDATRAWQGFFKLGVDGVVGPQTRGLMELALANIAAGKG